VDRTAVRPIFIVGCPRSGTTLLRLMLDSHPAISCGPETHFIGVLEQVMNRWPALERYGFDQDYWYDKLAELVHSFQHDYATRRGKQRWADKTPRYSLHLPFIDRLFPSSQVIHLIRDGRDVVASHRDSWGYKSALGAPDKWRRFIEAARQWGATAPPERYTELRYEELVADPERELRRILDFLGEPWDPAVLAHDRAEHDVYGSYAGGTEARRAQDQVDDVVYRSRVGRGRDLDPALRSLFKARAGGLARQLGYA
jgi:hypothetical protein